LSGGFLAPAAIFWIVAADLSASSITAALVVIGFGVSMVTGICVLIGTGLFTYSGLRWLFSKWR